jgi:hypothetical protein
MNVLPAVSRKLTNIAKTVQDKHGNMSKEQWQHVEIKYRYTNDYFDHVAP